MVSCIQGHLGHVIFIEIINWVLCHCIFCQTLYKLQLVEDGFVYHAWSITDASRSWAEMFSLKPFILHLPIALPVHEIEIWNIEDLVLSYFDFVSLCYQTIDRYLAQGLKALRTYSDQQMYRILGGGTNTLLLRKGLPSFRKGLKVVWYVPIECL